MSLLICVAYSIRSTWNYSKHNRSSAIILLIYLIYYFATFLFIGGVLEGAFASPLAVSTPALALPGVESTAGSDVGPAHKRKRSGTGDSAGAYQGRRLRGAYVQCRGRAAIEAKAVIVVVCLDWKWRRGAVHDRHDEIVETHVSLVHTISFFSLLYSNKYTRRKQCDQNKFYCFTWEGIFT